MNIAENVIMSAFRNQVSKLLYLGSACMYPKECEQPMKEDMLLTGSLEPTNEGYGLAKIGGSRLCSYLYRQFGVDFISAIPANAYGLNDSFDAEKSHVIPALIMKYHKAKLDGADHVDLWGTGKALREFIYTDDLASACLFLLEYYSDERPINIGTGREISIMELSLLIKRIVGYEGKIVCDPTKPDGMVRRFVDSSRINGIGWNAATSLEIGLQKVYTEYLRICRT
jgi:GDP-L-fucose synthase